MAKLTMSRIFFIPLAVIISTLLACAQSESLPAVLQNIQSIVAAGNADSAVQYQLSFDKDFPCNVSLHEHWRQDGDSWSQLYRFDLTDIEPGTFVQSKARRRAVVYDGHKILANGDRITFSEKRINNVSYRGELSIESRQQLLSAINTAIGICEERYSL